MKKIILNFVIIFFVLTSQTNAQQILSTANKPSQTSSRSEITKGPSIYGVFAGRTPCQEFLKELNMGERKACSKRKMGLTLYHDSITHQPATYETRGMGKWSGKGKWHIIKGIPGDSEAIVFQLDLDTNTFLYLLKGDDNVLFILDRNKQFLVGNANHSYTFNRVMN